MAFTGSSSSSGSKQKIWVDEMCNIFNLQLHFHPPSIFLLPEHITKQKLEAYEPQHLGLGPKNHFRLKNMRFEKFKHVFVQSLLNDNILNFKVVLETVRNLLPLVRPCYDSLVRLISVDDDYLSWIFAVDGCFLLYFFCTYNPGMRNENVPLPQQNDLHEHAISVEDGTGSRLLAGEIMMEENQIPIIVLKEINKALYQSSGNSMHPGIDLLLSGFRSFCEIHSPLILCDISLAPTYNVEHLLHYMYSSIIKNVPLDRGKEAKKDDKKEEAKKEDKKEDGKKYDKKEEAKKDDKKEEGKKEDKKEEAKKEDEMRMYPYYSAHYIYQTLEFIGKIPRNEIADLYKQTVQTLETICESKVAIPSASNLHNRAGFKFCLLRQDQGIKKIDIEGKDFYLPCVTLNEDSEVILRNLVAYEMLNGNINDFPLSEYVRLMSGLIMNVNDVKLLKKEHIIKGDLPDKEVIELFIGVSSSISSMKQKKKSFLQGKIDEVNKVYESTPRVKIYLFLQKLAYWLLVVLRPVGGCVKTSWKIVGFIFGIVTVSLLTFQAYCDAYGCDKTKVTLMPYTSS